MVNLVVGATGLLGGEICRQLAVKGGPVQALVRSKSDPGKIEALEQYGVELVRGDLKDRRSLDAACRGVKALLTTASTTRSRQEGDTIQTVDLEGQLSLVDAAKAAGVEHLIYISYRHVDPDLDCPLSNAKRSVEQHLKASGLTYTILWPGLFMEAWLSPRLGFDYPNAKARIYGSGQRALPWISFRDVARYAVAALDDPAARNATIDVGGELASPLEVVRIFEEVGGRPFTVEHVSEDALRTQKATASDPMGKTYAALMLGYATGAMVGKEAASMTLPAQLTSVKEYALQMLGAL
jgi:NADH dehydrogenase